MHKYTDVETHSKLRTSWPRAQCLLSFLHSFSSILPWTIVSHLQKQWYIPMLALENGFDTPESWELEVNWIEWYNVFFGKTPLEQRDTQHHTLMPWRSNWRSMFMTIQLIRMALHTPKHVYVKTLVKSTQFTELIGTTLCHFPVMVETLQHWTK